MLNKVTPFTTSIWFTNLGVDTSNAALQCQKLKSIVKTVVVSNEGGYQSPSFDENKFKEKFPEFYDVLLSAVNNIANDIQTPIKFENFWVNINKKGSSNRPHIHPQCSLSAVLYIKTPKDSGKILFKNPTPSEHYPLNDQVDGNFGVYMFQPSQGDLCVFPSYLSHWVEPSNSDEDRISIAINFTKI